MPWMYRDRKSEVLRKIGIGIIIFAVSLTAVCILASHLPETQNGVFGYILFGGIVGFVGLSLYGLVRFFKGVVIWFRERI